MPDIKRKIRPLQVCVVIVVFLLIVSGSLAYYATASAYDKIHKGVSVCGIDVGGMSRDEAYNAIKEKTEEALGDKNIAVLYGEKKHNIDINNKFNIDYSAVADNAYNIGRSKKLYDFLYGITGKKANIPLELQCDEKYIKSKITEFAEEIEKENSVYKFSNDMKKVHIDLSGSGIIVDVEATYNIFTDNASTMIFDDLGIVVQQDFNSDTAELLYKRLICEPVDASCEVINNKTVIYPDKVGISVDKNQLADNIAKGNKTFDIDVTAVMPQITSDKLESVLFKDILSSFTTKYNASNQSRSTNMAIAANKINGVVIAPGENFSFNKVVGARTYEKGYKDANVYIGGRVEQGVGGGICQVASTLYSAQLYADLQTVARSNHQFTVSYLPLGQDATVAWNSVDYVFKNNTKYPIKIIAGVSGGNHTVKILGTKTDKERTVKIVNNLIFNKEPNERVEYSSVLAPGSSVISQKGQSGATVDTYKVYLRNGVEEERVFLHRSVYNPMERVVMKSSVTAPPKESAPSVNNEIPAEEAPAESAAPQPISTPTPTPTPSEIPDEYISENGL